MSLQISTAYTLEQKVEGDMEEAEKKAASEEGEIGCKINKNLIILYFMIIPQVLHTTCCAGFLLLRNQYSGTFLLLHIHLLAGCLLCT